MKETFSRIALTLTSLSCKINFDITLKPLYLSSCVFYHLNYN